MTLSDNLYERLSNKRKKFQEQGLVPEWYTTSGIQLFEEKYEYETDESVKGQFKRIAQTAAKHLRSIGLEEIAEEKFFNLLWKGWLSPSTPVLANMGTDRGMPVSCSGGYIDDSIYGFYDARLETSILTKHGFGTSSYLGDIRPRGSSISVGGKASGILPVFKGFVQDMRDVAQGTSRRGAWAGYLPIDHGDFDELCDFIFNDPDDSNVGWNITDEFISKLSEQDPEAIRRFQKAMKLKMVTGRGYFFFVDKVNRANPESYKRHNLKVKASNLCITGDSKITVRYDDIEVDIPISSVGDLMKDGVTLLVKSYNILSKEIEWKPITDFALTKKNAKILKITDSETGKFIRCTPCHLLYTKNRGYVEAGNLKPDDKLVID